MESNLTDINAPGQNGDTALHVAASLDRLDCFDVLVKWLIDWSINLIDWLIDLSIVCLIDWLINWLDWLIDWLTWFHYDLLLQFFLPGVSSSRYLPTKLQRPASHPLGRIPGLRGRATLPVRRCKCGPHHGEAVIPDRWRTGNAASCRRLRRQPWSCGRFTGKWCVHQGPNARSDHAAAFGLLPRCSGHCETVVWR